MQTTTQCPYTPQELAAIPDSEARAGSALFKRNPRLWECAVMWYSSEEFRERLRREHAQRPPAPSRPKITGGEIPATPLRYGSDIVQHRDGDVPPEQDTRLISTKAVIQIVDAIFGIAKRKIAEMDARIATLATRGQIDDLQRRCVDLEKRAADVRLAEARRHRANLEAKLNGGAIERSPHIGDSQ